MHIILFFKRSMFKTKKCTYWMIALISTMLILNQYKNFVGVSATPRSINTNRDAANYENCDPRQCNGNCTKASVTDKKVKTGNFFIFGRCYMAACFCYPCNLAARDCGAGRDLEAYLFDRKNESS